MSNKSDPTEETQNISGITQEDLLKIHELTSLKYVPDDIGPRKSSFNQINTELKTERPLFLVGNPACGKTTVINKLRLDHKRFVYINAAQLSAPQQVFVLMYRALAKSEKAISSAKAFQLLQTLKGTVIIDEVDFLEKRQVLYDLFELQGIRLIMVANSLSFKESSKKIHSRLELAELIVFEDYSSQDLEELLKIRLGDYMHFFEKAAKKLLISRVQTFHDLRRLLAVTFRLFSNMFNNKLQTITAADVQKFTVDEDIMGNLNLLQLNILRLMGKKVEFEQIMSYCVQNNLKVEYEELRIIMKDLQDSGFFDKDGHLTISEAKLENILNNLKID